MSEPKGPVVVGDRVDGKYVVEAVLGIGGMGMVVRATHLDLDEQLALKFLLAEAAERVDAVERFLREARAVRKLRSEHVVRVLDVGRLGGAGLPYIAMELLDGQDLDHALRSGGPFPIDEACSYIIQACEALAEAHARGIVHRDLKPGNLFLARQPSGAYMIKVLDFGIAKTTGPEPSRTHTAAVVGSVFYMSPEQMRSSKTVDARSDIWSIGVTLFELLAGRPPFEGDNVPGLILSVTSDEAPSLRAFRPEVSPELESVVRRCLEKSPDARPPSMGELAMMLLPFAPPDARTVVEEAMAHGAATRVSSAAFVGAGTSSGKDPSVRAAVTAQQMTDASWATSPAATRSKSPVRIVIALGVVGIVAILAIWISVSRSHSAELGPAIPASGPASAAAQPPSAPAQVDSAATIESSPQPPATAAIDTAASAGKKHASPSARPAGSARPAVATTPKPPVKKSPGLGNGID